MSEDIAGQLSQEHLSAWEWTVLAVCATEPQRRAFIQGYNGQPLAARASARMRQYHERGQAVIRYHLLARENGGAK